jgi:sulfhydrogenase subunit beta (sulfur reductase)
LAIAGVLSVEGLAGLLARLREGGRRVLGPTVRDGAIVYDDVASLDDLPRGVTDRQGPGRYDLVPRDDHAFFGYAVGPHSWRRALLPPRHRLWTASRTGDATFRVVEAPPEDEPMAFLGVRACELAAISIQDRVLLQGLAEDTVYAARRADVVLVAVNCAVPAGTCFCVSMGTGPRVGDGADIVLTEVLGDSQHEFLVEVGTPAGAALVDGLAGRDATPDDDTTVERITDAAAAAMGRELDTSGIRELLLGSPEHPRWDDVASRCLGCTSCTMVCPTCFCTDVEDTTDLTGLEAHRDRVWDSCFSIGFSHAGSGSVRVSTRSRYRQWMTHKLAGWIDQFGTSGCVGCGRCITWCPVGIDITEEVAAIRGSADRSGDRS